ncbi:hypothetical protein [Hyphomicrobium sulfonivorans]|uniref:hypothetical protein n=1 Tax=Hyphomicrobium sulfonivorans TaxID=121290 RepID=UPI00156DEC5D|nr:hypothetical protein [Hyphomicrobium sulfonivorans]MBI1651159.1 hypothetical protein [Hyphomicrobium sulfonivorans]
MTPAAAIELLDERFHAIPRTQAVVDGLACIIRAKGAFACCSWPQRQRAFDVLQRLYAAGFEPAEDALNRLVNLH